MIVGVAVPGPSEVTSKTSPMARGTTRKELIAQTKATAVPTTRPACSVVCLWLWTKNGSLCTALERNQLYLSVKLMAHQDQGEASLQLRAGLP